MKKFEVLAALHWIFVVQVAKSLADFGRIEPIPIFFGFVGGHSFIDDFGEGILFLLSTIIQKG